MTATPEREPPPKEPCVKCGHAKESHFGDGGSCRAAIWVNRTTCCSCEKYQPAATPSEPPPKCGELPPDESPQRDLVCDALTEALVYVEVEHR